MEKICSNCDYWIDYKNDERGKCKNVSTYIALNSNNNSIITTQYYFSCKFWREKQQDKLLSEVYFNEY